MQDTQFVPATHCWCHWKSNTESSFSPRYRECERCGTHYSTQRLHPESYAAFYSYESYWQERQRSKDHPVLEERPKILRSGGRIEKWISAIERHVNDFEGLAVDIGCAEGTLLQALAAKGWKTLGIEPDPETARKAKESTGLDIRAGIFPNIELPVCSVITACDVMEHVADPVGFVCGARNTLAEGGILFLQQPILENEAGFGDMDSRVFDPEEHAFIFTRKSIAALLYANGFEVLENTDSWNPAHEIVVARKRTNPEISASRLLANLNETFSKRYSDFIDQLNAFGEARNLRTFCNWSKIWEYPRIWFDGLDKTDWRGKHLIDVGSERSPWPWFIASLGAKVTIIEASAEWVAHWEILREQLKLDVDWKITESCELPVESTSIDCVTSFSVLEHQSDKQLAVDEVVRVLKPEGIFGISFDVVEDGYGMTYPEWGGSAWSLTDFEETILSRPEFKPLVPFVRNTEDIATFLDWHRATAPHHNYVCAAASFRKTPIEP